MNINWQTHLHINFAEHFMQFCDMPTCKIPMKWQIKLKHRTLLHLSCNFALNLPVKYIECGTAIDQIQSNYEGKLGEIIVHATVFLFMSWSWRVSWQCKNYPLRKRGATQYICVIDISPHPSRDVDMPCACHCPLVQSWKVSWLLFTSIGLGTSHLDQVPKTNVGWQANKLWSHHLMIQKMVGRPKIWWRD